MELNSTQERGVAPGTPQDASPVGSETSPEAQKPVLMLAEHNAPENAGNATAAAGSATPAPVSAMGANPDDGAKPISNEFAEKKTTIQLFAPTTVRLTYRKRGNDTYDDVINRDLDSLGCPSAADIISSRGKTDKKDS